MSTSTNRTPKKPIFVETPQSYGGHKSGKGQSTFSVGGKGGKSVYGQSTRTILSSAGRRITQTKEEKMRENKPPIQVFDDEGQDVTPLPLLGGEFGLKQKQSNAKTGDSSGGTPTEWMSMASMYQTGGTVTASTFGGGPFTRSVFSGSVTQTMTESMATDDIGESQTELGGSPEITRIIREEPKEELSAKDLEKDHNITLTETDTIWLLDLTGVCVAPDTEDVEAIKANNEKYLELKKSRIGNDRYVERGMKTFNFDRKKKTVQTTKISYQDTGVSASNWDMNDTYRILKQQELASKSLDISDFGDFGQQKLYTVDVQDIKALRKRDKKEGHEENLPPQTDSKKPQQQSLSTLEAKLSVASIMSQTMSSFNITPLTAPSNEKLPVVEPDTKFLESEEFYKACVIVERAINLNNYQPKQALYRGLPIVEDIDAEVEEVDVGAKKVLQAAALVDVVPQLDRLWGYTCHLTKDRNVSCMAWNKTNPDILAVGYGQFDYNKQKGGLVCCWSIKNPEFPERYYTTNSGVTAIHFSKEHPNLLGVGLYNGTIAIYNVRRTKDEPILDSFETPGKHTSPVWQLNWIEKERGTTGDERSEVLVSISTDGRVTQWSIRKGFESYDLMKLKRVVKTSHGKTKKPEALISKHAGGLCFDFHAKDSNIYLAGTEEGQIHKCSCSYNEQFLDSYHGHTGPVYKVQWSPFASEIFLSCSGDWTVRLWHQDYTHPILTFHSSTKSVPEMCWSPRSATVFACVNEKAVEIWDLSLSVLDPIIVNEPVNSSRLSSVSFSPISDCVLVGDADGTVQVIELKSMPPRQEKKDELMKIVNASLSSQLKVK